jgi:hypothetical protein
MSTLLFHDPLLDKPSGLLRILRIFAAINTVGKTKDSSVSMQTQVKSWIQKTIPPHHIPERKQTH